MNLKSNFLKIFGSDLVEYPVIYPIKYPNKSWLPNTGLSCEVVKLWSWNLNNLQVWVGYFFEIVSTNTFKIIGGEHNAVGQRLQASYPNALPRFFYISIQVLFYIKIKFNSLTEHRSKSGDLLTQT
jgi:hypothetical protein